MTKNLVTSLMDAPMICNLFSLRLNFDCALQINNSIGSWTNHKLRPPWIIIFQIYDLIQMGTIHNMI
jgi:hypothetical protein